MEAERIELLAESTINKVPVFPSTLIYVGLENPAIGPIPSFGKVVFIGAPTYCPFPATVVTDITLENPGSFSVTDDKARIAPPISHTYNILLK
jgi:hypothetical protein